MVNYGNCICNYICLHPHSEKSSSYTHAQVFLCLKQTQKNESNLVTDPVQGIFTLTQILDQFLGLQQTHALFLGFLQQEVPQVMELLQTSLVQVTKVGRVNKVSDKK